MFLSLVFGQNFKTISKNFDWAQALISLAIFFPAYCHRSSTFGVKVYKDKVPV
jgi:hypothetical protein